MFYGCQSLTSLDLSNFYTPKVENMGGIFGKCLNLNIVDIKNFETNNLIVKSNLFNEVADTGTIYYNSKIFNETLLEFKTIKNWKKIDVAK